jgi:hypothetical protein
MNATIEIEMNNAAFTDAPAYELARILRRLADHVDDGGVCTPLRDSNGNTVGQFNLAGTLPPLCTICGEPAEDGEPICEECTNA